MSKSLNHRLSSDIPELCREDESDDNSDDWGEINSDTDEQESPILCLFCEHSSKSMKEAIVHVEQDHKLSFQDLQIKFNLDQYGFIKVHSSQSNSIINESHHHCTLLASQMVNYIRKNQTSPEEILQATSCSWNEEAYLKPSDQSRIDWLMFGRALYDYHKNQC